jgi:hypothetical protein
MQHSGNSIYEVLAIDKSLLTNQTMLCFIVHASTHTLLQLWGFMELPISPPNEAAANELIMTTCQQLLDGFTSSFEEVFQLPIYILVHTCCCINVYVSALYSTVTVYTLTARADQLITAFAVHTNSEGLWLAVF